MKADEVRLYALRGGLKKQSVCYTHFHSNKVFRGDHLIQSDNRRDSGTEIPNSAFLIPNLKSIY